MDLFSLLAVGQRVQVVLYTDELPFAPAHYLRPGVITDFVNGFYAVDLGGIIEIIDGLKLEAIV